MIFCIAYIVISLLVMVVFGVKLYRELSKEPSDWMDFVPAMVVGLLWPISLGLVLVIGFTMLLASLCKKISNYIDKIKDYVKYE